MGLKRMAESVATCRFGEAGATNGLLHGLLDQTWIQVVPVLLCRSAWRYVLAKAWGMHHRSPTRRQILRMEAVNLLELPVQSLALASSQQCARSFGAEGYDGL